MHVSKILSMMLSCDSLMVSGRVCSCRVGVFVLLMLAGCFRAVEGFAADWSPAELSSVVAWYDANDASTISVSGSSVTQWADKSGNDYHLEQTSASSRPTTGHDFNGKNALRFAAASSQYLYTTSSVSYANSGDLMIYTVYKLNGSSNGYGFLVYGRAPSVIGLGLLSANLRYQPIGGGTTTAKDTAQHILGSYLIGGSSAGARRDGTSIHTSSGSYELTSSVALYVGAQVTPTVYPIDADIAEVLVVNSYDADTLLQIEGYLAWKWGLQAKLPSGHRYKSVVPNSATTAVDFGADYVSSIVNASATVHGPVSGDFDFDGSFNDTARYVTFGTVWSPSVAPGWTTPFGKSGPNLRYGKSVANLGSATVGDFATAPRRGTLLIVR